MRAQLRIPVAVKLSPFFTALPNMAQRFAEAGADGLVLFNRFYQPDFDLEQLEVVPNLTLSTSDELRLPLRWIAMLYGRVDGRLRADRRRAYGRGRAQGDDGRRQRGDDDIRAAGPRHRPRCATSWPICETWMDEHEYESIAQMRGSMSQRAVAEPAAFERANYMKALNSFDNRLP